MINCVSLTPSIDDDHLLSRFKNHCYRPQTKFAKVMFSLVVVCPQWGGGSVHKGVCVGESLLGGLCPGGCLSRGSLSQGLCSGVSVRGVSVQGGLCLGGYVSRGSLSRGVSVQGSLSRRISITVNGKERALCTLLECILNSQKWKLRLFVGYGGGQGWNMPLHLWCQIWFRRPAFSFALLPKIREVSFSWKT